MKLKFFIEDVEIANCILTEERSVVNSKVAHFSKEFFKGVFL